MRFAGSPHPTRTNPNDQFRALYGLRWSIEGDFRIQKSPLQIENFSGKRIHVIAQDVHAKIITKHVACGLPACAQARQDALTAAHARSPNEKTEPAKPAARRVPVKARRRQRTNVTDALQVCQVRSFQRELAFASPPHVDSRPSPKAQLEVRADRCHHLLRSLSSPSSCAIPK